MSQALWLDRYQEIRTRRFLRSEARRQNMLPSWRTRPRARILVTALALALAVMAVAGAVCEVDTDLGLPIWLAGIVLFLASWTPLQIVTGRLCEAPRDALDEREALQRDGARSIGLVVTQALVFFAVLYLLTRGVSGQDAKHIGYAGGIFVLTGLLIGACTPTMILAWNTPTPDPHDDLIA